MKKILAAALIVITVFALGACSSRGAAPGGAASGNSESTTPAAEDWNIGNAEMTGPVEALSIDWANGNVKVVYGDVSAVSIAETCKKELTDEKKMQWYLDGTKLWIKTPKEKGFITFGSGYERELTVTLPEGSVLDGLAADSSAGDITIEVNVREISADSSAGDILIRAAEPVDKIYLDSSAGNIDLAAPQIGRLEVDTSAGDVAIETAAFESASLDSSAGNVTMKMPADISFTAEIDLSAGDFTSEFPLKNDGEKYICGSGEGDLIIDVSAGDVSFLEAKQGLF